MTDAQPPLGEYLGSGGSRRVYVHGENPEWVIKIPHDLDAEQFAEWTLREWHNFHALTDAGFGHYIAPCIDVHPDGHWLIMAKTESIPVEVEAYIPAALDHPWVNVNDTNSGWYEGRVVCIDYVGANPDARRGAQLYGFNGRRGFRLGGPSRRTDGSRVVPLGDPDGAPIIFNLE